MGIFCGKIKTTNGKEIRIFNFLNQAGRHL